MVDLVSTAIGTDNSFNNIAGTEIMWGGRIFVESTYDSIVELTFFEELNFSWWSDGNEESMLDFSLHHNFFSPDGGGGIIYEKLSPGEHRQTRAYSIMTNTYYYFEYYLSGHLENTRFEPLDGERVNYFSSCFSFEVTPMPVPEPTTMLLFGTGLAGLAAVARRRK